MSQLTELDPARLGILLGMLAVVGGVIISVSTAVTGQWRRVREAEINAALKAQMLDQGMAAADIVKVLDAGRPPEPGIDGPTMRRHKHHCC